MKKIAKLGHDNEIAEQGHNMTKKSSKGTTKKHRDDKGMTTKSETKGMPMENRDHKGTITKSQRKGTTTKLQRKGMAMKCKDVIPQEIKAPNTYA